jgi:hypothetical protein
MPEKRRCRGCGKNCIRCWRNNLKHGNKLKIKKFKKQNVWYKINEWDIEDNKNDRSICNFTNIEEYFNNKIIIENNLIFLNDINKIKMDLLLENYNYWLSDTKKIKPIKKKTFLKHILSEIKKYDSVIIKNGYI